MGIMDDLFKTAGSVGPKKSPRGGQGKIWDGGHESTYKKGNSINHHSKNHRTGKTSGWDYNTKTGASKKYSR